jgi:hypothetical protein
VIIRIDGGLLLPPLSRGFARDRALGDAGPVVDGVLNLVALDGEVIALLQLIIDLLLHKLGALTGLVDLRLQLLLRLLGVTKVLRCWARRGACRARRLRRRRWLGRRTTLIWRASSGLRELLLALCDQLVLDLLMELGGGVRGAREVRDRCRAHRPVLVVGWEQQVLQPA